MYISGFILNTFNLIRVFTPGQWLEDLIEPFYRAAHAFFFGLGL